MKSPRLIFWFQNLRRSILPFVAKVKRLIQKSRKREHLKKMTNKNSLRRNLKSNLRLSFKSSLLSKLTYRHLDATNEFKCSQANKITEYWSLNKVNFLPRQYLKKQGLMKLVWTELMLLNCLRWFLSEFRRKYQASSNGSNRFWVIIANLKLKFNL